MPDPNLVLAWRNGTPAQRAALEAQYAAQQRQGAEETGWQYFMRRAGSPAPTLQAADAINRGLDFTFFSPTLQRNLAKLNPNRTQAGAREERQQRDPTFRVANAPLVPGAPAGPGTPSGLAFSAPAGGAGGNQLLAALAQFGGGGAAPAGPAPSASDFLRQQGLTVTSGDRTQERQQQLIAEWERGGRRGVRPADNSWHLQTGRAADVRKTPGLTLENLRKRYTDAGWTVNEAIDEGDHFHIAASPPGGGGGSQASGGPRYVGLDPMAMAGLIPAPRLLDNVDLPDAPQQEALPARTPYEQIDKAGFLAPLAQALEVPDRDRTSDPWDRVQAMLIAGAQGLAGTDPSTDFGRQLLAAGGAAGGGFRAERNDQRELDREDENKRREARAALARAGFDVDMANLGTRNTNLDRSDMDAREDAQRKFNNLNVVDQRNVQEILLGRETQQSNNSEINQTNRARGQAYGNVVQSNNALANRAIDAEYTRGADREDTLWKLSLQAALGDGDGAAPGASLLRQFGIPTEAVRGEPAPFTIARSVAPAVAQGNMSLALSGLAAELAANGKFSELLSEDEVKAVENAIRQEKPDAAITIINGALQLAAQGQDSETLRAWISTLATAGGPTAQLINSRLQAPAAAR